MAAATIDAEVAAFLEADVSGGVAGSIDPRLRRACAQALAIDWVPGRRSLSAACLGEWRVFVPVSDGGGIAPAAALGTAVRLRTGLTRGSVIAPADLELAAVPGASGSDFVRRIEDASGKRLSRSLAAGTPLRLAMLEQAPTVRRRDRVTLVADGGGFAISADAEALEDGSPGSRVLVRNLSSGKRLRGVVGPGGEILIAR